MVPSQFDENQVKAKVESTYGCTCATVLQHYDDVRCLASAGVIVQKKPESKFAVKLLELAKAIS